MICSGYRVCETTMFRVFLAFLVLFLVSVNCEEEPTQASAAADETPNQSDQEKTSDDGVPLDTPSKEDENYKLGSLCNYCSYCKLCKLCDKDCPCKTSKSKPNCHLCKYCKYCFLCSTCDVACTPGGIIDTLTSAIYSSLPSFTKKEQEEVDKDIKKAKDWIKEYL